MAPLRHPEKEPPGNNTPAHSRPDCGGLPVVRDRRFSLESRVVAAKRLARHLVIPRWAVPVRDRIVVDVSIVEQPRGRRDAAGVAPDHPVDKPVGCS
eukprot:9485491-Pyramimonas_sp.AAC.1